VRADRLRAVALLVFAAIPSLAWSAAAPPDSAAVRPAPARADTTRAPVTRSAVRDTTRLPAAQGPTATVLDTTVLRPSHVIDVAAERKEGAASLEELFPGRIAVSLAPLPVSGPSQGSLRLPDGGGPIRLDGWARAGETTTDEPWVGSFALGWGAPWLAFALDDPRSDAVEVLDLNSIELSSPPGDFRTPGEALTRPVPHGPVFTRAPGDTSRGGVSSTTLAYRRGSGGAQLAGARFQTSVLHRGVYGSFLRNQANGWSPLRETVTSRYELMAELMTWASHRFEVEGLVYDRSLDDSSSGSSEWERRSAALRVSHDGTRVSDAWRLGIGRSKATSVLTRDLNVTPDAGARERWEFPAVTAEGLLSYRAGSAWTWIGSFQAASRTIRYRADSVPAFEPRREEARMHLGARYALGPSAGLGIDAAYDARETQPGFLDARASLWTDGERTRGRIDLESAHDRPSWPDLLTPATSHTFVSPSTFAQTELSRSGDPTLRPRRLSGGLGSLGFTVSRGFDLTLRGSYRRVTDDFGWDVVADTVGGLFDVSSVARRRGSGWLSHGAIGWEFQRGVFRTRGLGWIRGGPDSLSPQAGSPPRRALDARAEVRVVLFQGDLPLHFGIESHARGPRQGLIHEAGQMTWDGTLSADFGSAGAFVRVQDLFDRRAGSGIWDPAVPSGAPMPGRIFQAGVVWNLLD
jgi:hypothetical protein